MQGVNIFDGKVRLFCLEAIGVKSDSIDLKGSSTVLIFVESLEFVLIVSCRSTSINFFRKGILLIVHEHD